MAESRHVIKEVKEHKRYITTERWWEDVRLQAVQCPYHHWNEIVTRLKSPVTIILEFGLNCQHQDCTHSVKVEILPSTTA